MNDKDSLMDYLTPELIKLSAIVAQIDPKMDISPVGTVRSAGILLTLMRERLFNLQNQ
jgi:hypothetical protein